MGGAAHTVGLQRGRFLGGGCPHPRVKQPMFLAQEPRAGFCAPDNKFPHTYTEISVSASGCLASWNSGLLITRKGHQEKKESNEKPERLETSSPCPELGNKVTEREGDCRGLGLAGQGAQVPAPSQLVKRAARSGDSESLPSTSGCPGTGLGMGDAAPARRGLHPGEPVGGG